MNSNDVASIYIYAPFTTHNVVCFYLSKPRDLTIFLLTNPIEDGELFKK